MTANRPRRDTFIQGPVHRDEEHDLPAILANENELIELLRAGVAELQTLNGNVAPLARAADCLKERFEGFKLKPLIVGLVGGALAAGLIPEAAGKVIKAVMVAYGVG